MSYYAPDGEVILCKGVNIDRNYNHTLLPPDNKEEQFGKIVNSQTRKYQLGPQSYQRAGIGKMRVQLLADNLYDCNYMVFRNSKVEAENHFGVKWFYAFIDNVEYINNNCTEITYSIDVIQTWWYDFEINQTFVEREHSATDGFGENVVPEDIGAGDMLVEHINNIDYSDDTYVVIYYVPQDNALDENIVAYIDIKDKAMFPGDVVIHAESELTVSPATSASGTVAGFKVCGFKYNEATASLALGELVKWMLKKSNSIIAVSQIPGPLFRQCITDEKHQGSAYFGGITNFEQDVRFNATGRFHYKHNTVKKDGYSPKNNKLYQYPYRQLIISNNEGKTATLKWENFSIQPKNASFKLIGGIFPSSEILMYPTQYRNLENDYDSGISLTNFIECSWSEDSFTKWWEQNKSSIGTGLLSSTLVSGLRFASSGGGTTTSMNPARIQRIPHTATIYTFAYNTTVNNPLEAGKAGIPLANQVLSSIGQIGDAYATPDQLSGQFGTSGLRLLENRFGFTLYDMGTDGETAETIDNYFTMFGYATKKVKIPNIFTAKNRRPKFNYLKTQACVIHPRATKGLSAGDEEAIAGIFDNGITFWTNLEEVGNYSLDNGYVAPVTPEPEPEPTVKYNIPFESQIAHMTQGYIPSINDGYDLVPDSSNHNIISISDGTVQFAGYVHDEETGGRTWEWGNHARILDSDGYLHIYAHMRELPLVRIGQTVRKGDRLGVMGNTGKSEGAHLHYQLRKNGVDLCPEITTNIPNVEGIYKND